jgi:HEAT repeat protein
MRTLLFVLLAPAAFAGSKDRVKEWTLALNSRVSAERLAAIAGLGASGDKRALVPLLLSFNVPKAPPPESEAIARALGRLRRKEAVEPLMGAWDYLASVQLQLGDLPPSLASLRLQIIESLGLLGDDLAEAVVLHALESEDARTAETAARAAGRIRLGLAYSRLVDLSRKEGDLRQAAIEALGDLGDPRAEEILERYLDDQDNSLRAESAYALALLGKKKGRGTLRTLLESPSEPDRVLAAYYLLKLDDKDGLKALSSAACSSRSAVMALGKAGNGRAAKKLTECLESQDSLIRLLSVQGLGRLGGGRAVDALERAKQDSSPEVRQAAQTALVDLGR